MYPILINNEIVFWVEMILRLYSFNIYIYIYIYITPLLYTFADILHNAQYILINFVRNYLWLIDFYNTIIFSHEITVNIVTYKLVGS